MPQADKTPDLAVLLHTAKRMFAFFLFSSFQTAPETDEVV